jgi:hypothetical protein
LKKRTFHNDFSGRVPESLEEWFPISPMRKNMNLLSLLKKILTILMVLIVSMAMVACSTTEDEENAEALDRML